MIHPQNVEKYAGDLTELAEDIGNLKYDALAEFLHALSAKIEKDGAKDKARGRIQLSSSLHACSAHLSEAALSIEQAWRISKPYMTADPIDQAEHQSA